MTNGNVEHVSNSRGFSTIISMPPSSTQGDREVEPSPDCISTHPQPPSGDALVFRLPPSDSAVVPRLSSLTYFAYPQIPLSKSLRGAERPVALYSSDKISPLAGTFHTQESVETSQPSSQLPPPRRIPRPPNAFMIFRSDFLKKGVIPPGVERRQQNLSRIAGEVWNRMPVSEKAIWHEQAANVLAEHRNKNPDYKFMPVPRGTRRTKVKQPPERDPLSPERVRQICDKFTHVTGPAVPPVRRRKTRTAQTEIDCVKREPQPSPSLFTVPSCPILPPPSPYPSQPSLPIPSDGQDPYHLAHSIHLSSSPQLPAFFPQETYPYLIIPQQEPLKAFCSPSLQSEKNDSDTRLSRPSSAVSSHTGLSNILGSFEITPTVADFGNISMQAIRSSSPISVLPSTAGCIVTDRTCQAQHSDDKAPIAFLTSIGHSVHRPVDCNVNNTFQFPQNMMVPPASQSSDSQFMTTSVPAFDSAYAANWEFEFGNVPLASIRCPVEDYYPQL